MEIKGRTFLVTGGAQGMGRCFVEELSKIGANAIFCDINDEGIAEVELACSNYEGIVRGMVLNVAEQDTVVDGQIVRGIDKSTENFNNFLDFAISITGDIDGIINNAGIIGDGLIAKFDKRTGGTKVLSNDKWKQVIDINLTGVFLGTRAYAEWHIANEKKEGVIISISSISRHGNQGQSNYSAAKSAIVSMTALWAGELSRYGIRTGAIAPGFTKTPILEGMPPEALERVVAPVPLKRMADPTEMFKAVQFIIECDYFTGRVIDVDGGLRLP
jgi:3-oxoacyl-[acyl-carrier protein] reductase